MAMHNIFQLLLSRLLHRIQLLALILNCKRLIMHHEATQSRAPHFAHGEMNSKVAQNSQLQGPQHRVPASSGSRGMRHSARGVIVVRSCRVVVPVPDR